MKNKYLVCGAGGFIGGHIVKSLMDDGHEVICADIKPLENWFQVFASNKNFSLDLKNYENCLEITKNVEFIYNMACNMGGMGFIENNKAECMLSVLINTNLLRACLVNNIKRYFFSSSACVYNADKQNINFIKVLKESDAYPAMPEDGYGWEKLFSERMCRHFYEDYGLETRIARYHNVYGPLGTFDGGREKAPAALCRKLITAKNAGIKKIDVWGDGEQTRSFIFINDCIKGTKKIFQSNCREVLNIGSEEQVSVNQMIRIIEEISKYKVEKNYMLNMPKGVRGRSSNNDLVRSKLGWDFETSLKSGLEITYKWIEKEISKKLNNNKFSIKY
jgi:nucleoside-diphosphate-sugar epimerase